MMREPKTANREVFASLDISMLEVQPSCIDFVGGIHVVLEVLLSVKKIVCLDDKTNGSREFASALT
jgi:hypothetical protein